MTKENENSESRSQDPDPSGPEPGKPEDLRDPGPPPLELDASTTLPKPQPAPKSSAAKIALIVLTLAVAALGGTVYLLLQERAKAFSEIREEQARFDSQLQEMEEKQNAIAQSVKGLETVWRDAQAFKDETSARIGALDQELKNALQQMAAARQALSTGTAETAGSLPESGTASGETAGQPVEEKARDGDVKTPAQPEPRSAEKNKEIQRYLDFVEFIGSKTSELLREGFNKARDYLADLLK